MPTITDSEFGDVVVRLNHMASRITLRIAPNGQLRISAPTGTPMIAIKTTISISRRSIRQLFDQYKSQVATYNHDQSIGKSHHLVIQKNASANTVSKSGTKILVSLNSQTSIDNLELQLEIKKQVIAALRKEAKAYLPRRLEFLAHKHGFSYDRVQLTHSSSRWGSCSSKGTISLNIALMNLPFELLDYVLYHELSHTRHMNHSDEFWSVVASIDPDYKMHRKLLKTYSPNI